MPEWRFLLDENIDPKTATYLRKEGVDVEHVRDTLGEGADDEADILPYARETDRIVVTSDVSDFGALNSDAHAGVVLLYDDTMAAYSVAAGLLGMIDAYGSRDRFGGRERLDPWC
ncbi:MAG: protein of unknown function DUF82 [Halonotius sp. J07HN6]|jgi:Uncharacterized protein conserved in bacteria|nr:MAG: protein of unknown function DUF82 [Halonotius sp. J07HN6]ESS08423.1 MAG: Mut7-C RNAse domain protein [uncultured archaeon A07HN63]